NSLRQFFRDRIRGDTDIHTFAPHVFDQALSVDLQFFGEIVESNFRGNCSHALLAFGQSGCFSSPPPSRSALQERLVILGVGGEQAHAPLRARSSHLAAISEASHCFSSFRLSFVAAASLGDDSRGISVSIVSASASDTVAVSATLAASRSATAVEVISGAGVTTSGRGSGPASSNTNSATDD